MVRMVERLIPETGPPRLRCLHEACFGSNLLPAGHMRYKMPVSMKSNSDARRMSRPDLGSGQSQRSQPDPEKEQRDEK